MTSCTDEQLQTLLDYLEENRDLAKGLLVRSADGRRRSKLLWDKISQQLNSLGGSCKTTQQWQKVWSDRKYLAKKNAAFARRSLVATGGGEGCPPLASWELKVLSIMGEGFGAPSTTARVPVMVPPAPLVIVPPPTAIDLDLEIASYAEVPAEPNTSFSASRELDLQSTEEQNEAVQGTRTLRRHRPRPSRNTNLKETITKMEKDKMDVLRGIKDELHGLTAAVKELIDLIKNSAAAVRP